MTATLTEDFETLKSRNAHFEAMVYGADKVTFGNYEVCRSGAKWSAYRRNHPMGGRWHESDFDSLLDAYTWVSAQDHNATYRERMLILQG